MKRKTLFTSPCWFYLVCLSILTILSCTAKIARAQYNSPTVSPGDINSSPNVDNIVSPPRASDKFFESGREDFERGHESSGDSETPLDENLSESSKRPIEQIESKEAFDYLEQYLFKKLDYR